MSSIEEMEVQDEIDESAESLNESMCTSEPDFSIFGSEQNNPIDDDNSDIEHLISPNVSLLGDVDVQDLSERETSYQSDSQFLDNLRRRVFNLSSNSNSTSTVTEPNHNSDSLSVASSLSLDTTISAVSIASLSSISVAWDDDHVRDGVDNYRLEWLYQPIYENAAVCGGEALFRILKLYVANRLTKKALAQILSTINYLLPETSTIPKTNYMLLKLIDKVLPHSQADLIVKYRICDDCFKLLGLCSETLDVHRCTRCSSSDVSGMFLMYSIESVLRDAFEVRKLHELIDEYTFQFSKKDPEKYYDLMSGSEFRYLKNEAIPEKYDLCLLWCVDGVPTADGSGSELWPIHAQIMNIAPRYRRSFQFVAGLYYCNRKIKKPEMSSYLEPFATTLQHLYANGVDWIHPTLGCTINSKVIAPVATLDAPARASVQNIMQYNGECGCSACEHPGESCETGEGHNRVFRMLLAKPQVRTAERMEAQAIIAELYRALIHFKGVKGRSVASKIPFFDTAKGFVPDYLHAVLLGVIKMLLTLWFILNNRNEPYYLNKRLRDEIEELLSSIKPPDNVTRTPRKLKNLKFWKASEFRAFLLFYGPIVLRGRLSSKYYEHYLLLVRAIHILLQEEIDPLELDLAETLLHIFVTDVEALYGREKCSFNIHQLLHLTAYVRMWGPLWAWSTFSSEDGNGQLMKIFHGPNRTDVEIFNTIKVIHAYQSIRYLMNMENPKRHHGFEPHGPPTQYVLTNDDKKALHKATLLTEEELQETDFVFYCRCKINNDIYTSDLYNRQNVRDNSYIYWKGSTVFGVIKSFVSIDLSLYAIVRQLIISHDKSLEIRQNEIGISLSSMIKPIRDSYCIHAIPVNTIEGKTLRVLNYVCIFPNDVERK